MEERSKMESSAADIVSQPVVASRPEQWGLLTALSTAAKERKQGQDMVLFKKEHVFGRLVPDRNFKFEPSNVSGKHCKIYLETEKNEQGEETTVVLVQDSSSNGTYISGQRLEKNGKAMPLRQGDILSLVGPPESEAAFAYVFRTVRSQEPALTSDQAAPAANRQPATKRKPSPPAFDMAPFSEQPSESKRPRGSEHVVRLDDVKRLQKSNEELRTKLEEQVRATEKAKLALRSADETHQEEKGKLEAEWKAKLEQAQAQVKEQATAADALKATQAQQQSAIEDLQQRLTAAGQSREEAEEAIKKNLTTIEELERSLEEERKARASERAQADADQKAALEKARVHAQEELARKMESAARELEDQAKRLQVLQEADKENRAQNETLRAKLEAERRSLVEAQEQARRLQARVEEETAGVGAMQEQLEREGRELREKERALQQEKAQRAQADLVARSHSAALDEKLSELAMERQRLQGLRERILVRETQLRAFHSTTAEISPLFAKMQQQLTTMMSVSALASEDAPSGGLLEGANSPPENEDGGESAREKSPARDMNMTQLEEEDDVVMSTAPVLRTTPRKTPRKETPVQRHSGARVTHVGRALHFEENEEGVFAKPADRTPLGEDVRRASLDAADENEEKVEGRAEVEEGVSGNEGQEENEMKRDEENDENEGDKKEEEKKKEDIDGVEREKEAENSEACGREEIGGGETMMMEDDVIATLHATYAGETLLMEEQGGLFAAKSAPLAGIPEEDFDESDGKENVNVATQIEGAKEDANTLTQIEGANAMTQIEGPVGKSEGALKTSESEEGEGEQKGGNVHSEEAEGKFTPQKNSIGDTALVKEAALTENGQPPDSVQMSEFPDDILKRRASLGDGDVSASKARRQSLLQKMDALMDVEFTEKEVAASPAEQGSQEPSSDAGGRPQEFTEKEVAASPAEQGLQGPSSKASGRPFIKVEFMEKEVAASPAEQAGGRPRAPAASAPAGERPTAGSRSPTAVKRLFRRRSFGSEPQAKRFKEEEVVQDSGSEQKVPFAEPAVDGTPSESVSRKRGGSSNEESAENDDDCPKKIASSQRSASGNELPSPGLRNANGFAPANERGFPDTQATGNDLNGAGQEEARDLPDSLAGLQCSEAMTSANLEMTSPPIEMTPSAMPQPTRPPPAPRTRTPRRVERTGQGRFDPNAMAGLDTWGMHVGGSLQSDGRVGDSESEEMERGENGLPMEEESEDVERDEIGLPVETEPLRERATREARFESGGYHQSHSPAFST